MSNNTIKRTDLVKVLCEEVGLARKQCTELLEDFLSELADRLAEGEPIKVPNFGSFVVRHKGERVGRNLKTGEAVPIPPRRVVVFQPARKLKHWINHPEDLPRRPRKQLDLFLDYLDAPMRE